MLHAFASSWCNSQVPIPEDIKKHIKELWNEAATKAICENNSSLPCTIDQYFYLTSFFNEPERFLNANYIPTDEGSINLIRHIKAKSDPICN